MYVDVTTQIYRTLSATHSGGLCRGSRSDAHDTSHRSFVRNGVEVGVIRHCAVEGWCRRRTPAAHWA